MYFKALTVEVCTVCCFVLIHCLFLPSCMVNEDEYISHRERKISPNSK